MLAKLLPSLSDSGTTYKCGTLEYTKRGLVVMCLWILWGETCFTFVEAAEPSVLPFILKGLGASNLVISVYALTIAQVFGMLLGPIIAVKSDRYRSRFGRRIPFMAFSMPFVVLFMILMGYHMEIGRFFFSHLFAHSGASQATVTIVLMALLVAGYQLFHLIVNSVYFYLFNDVVPEQFLGRFLAFFRAIGTAMAALFHIFVFPYAQTHSKEILVLTGIVYFVGFTMMILKIKEGQYPPPPPLDKAKGSAVVSAVASVRMYMRECFCHKFYWYLYLSSAILNAGFATGPFYVFRNLDVGLTMREMGAISGVTTLLCAILLVPAGYLVDKKHPVRLGMFALAVSAVLSPLDALFLLNLSHRGALIVMIVTRALGLPFGTIYQATQMPLIMRVLPHSRFGQFCSAMNVVRSAFLLVAGIAAGLFVDGLRWWCQDIMHFPDDYYYRFIFLFGLPTIWIAVYLRWKIYKMWLEFGGDDNYLPPCYEQDELKYKKDKEAAGANNEDKSTEQVT